MIITCAECQARFRLADEKLKPGGTKVRCSKCQHVFTVLPPAAAPPEEVVDYGDFNMERVADEEAAPAPAPPSVEPPPEPVDVPEPPSVQTGQADETSAAGDMDLDFSGLEQSMGPGAGDSEAAEEFSFADSSAEGEPATGREPTTSDFGTVAPVGDSQLPGELDFDTTFAETDEPAATPPATGPAEFAFDEELSASGTAEPLAENATFDFAAEPEAPAAGDFGFTAESAASELSEFSFETEAGEENFAFAEEPATPEKVESFEFGSGENFESSALPAEPASGEEAAATWEQPDKAEGLSFNFDEPSFESEEQPTKSGDEAPLGFGEIDFSDDAGETPEFGSTPSFGGEPDFSQATLSRPAEPEVPPIPPPPAPRPAADRPRSGEPLPAPALPRKSPMSRILLILVLLLLILCGAGGYFYFMGGGQEVVERLLLKVKGEEPSAPVEQRISLAIAGSSYVDNRDAGQLLVIQGSATNNFAGARSAITVKGVILDAGGKVLQQQTVFCGNPLSEEKLRIMKYAQIEEAMNNQFGDSLANMNLKAGAAIPFTIVFRNVPKELANINVEVVDSKPGGL